MELEFNDPETGRRIVGHAEPDEPMDLSPQPGDPPPPPELVEFFQQAEIWPPAVGSPPPVDEEGDRRPGDGEHDEAWNGFEEPGTKAGADVTRRCAPEGIDPGDERYAGRPVHVDFDTGTVTVEE